jgi:hypothetical protein
MSTEPTEGVGGPTPGQYDPALDRVDGPDHRAEAPVLTQSKAFWRTALQIGPAALVSLCLVLPEILEEFVERFGTQLPDGLRLWLLGLAGALTLVSSIIAWFMSNPKVLAWTTKYARFFALPTK